MGVKIAFAATILVFAAPLVKTDDKKWVWSDNARNSKSAQDRRYEVLEDDRPYAPNYRPGRPTGSNFLPNRPSNGLFRPSERPGGIYGQQTNGGYGDRYPGVLTGPVPSWEFESPYKEFDRCKCTEKFNCNTPGFSYGHCDVGKQYCCYSTKQKNPSGAAIPNIPVHSSENGILIGPGGPVDYPVPNRPSVNRPGINRPGINRPGINRPIEGGILVGPGGPTGIIGRPPYGNQSPYRLAKENDN